MMVLLVMMMPLYNALQCQRHHKICYTTLKTNIKCFYVEITHKTVHTGIF